MRPGDLIAGRFEVERFVARGGMGEVYRAIDQTTGRPVALKLLPAGDTTPDRRLAFEARALLSLNHPAIVRYVAHDTDAERGSYLAMEWIDGITLSRRLRIQPLALDECLDLAARIADGLGAAHARGMIHRDIKPLNIMLANGRIDQVRILDFGIVRLGEWQQITGTGVGMGTPEYMAPEQARCDKRIGPGADVFALGCILFKCLTGQTAFSGGRIEAVLAKIAMVAEPPRVAELRPDIPRPLDDLVRKMMAYDPGARPRDGAAASAAIRAVRAQLRAGVEPTADVRLPSSLTTSERQPVSVIFAELELGEADTVPSAIIAVDALKAAPPGDLERPSDREISVPTDADSLEQIRVMRGSSDMARLLPAVRRATEVYGARVEVLLNGSLVAMLSGGAAATDLATRSARCALAIRHLLPEAAVGIATRQAVKDDRRSISPIIDAAAALVRPGSRQIRIDRSTRDLLPASLEVAGEHEGLILVGERAGAHPPEEPPRLLLGKETPCVGRDRQLRQLGAAYQGCAEDRVAQAVVVIGAAGAGKSRLRAELIRRLREPAAAAPAVVAAWGDPVRAKVPHGLLARALTAYFELPDEPRARRAVLSTEAVEKLPEPERVRVSEFLGELCAAKFPSDDSPALRAARQDPELMADQVRRAFTDWLAAECEATPVVLVIDDLQWADQPSVELIGAALRRARDLPLLVLALGRPEAHERFPQLGDDWGRQELVLDELRPAACETLVKAALGDAVDADTRRRIIERSAGNAFYLEEMIRAVAAGDRQLLPDSVIASAQLRIARLPEGARQVLRAAAIYGRTFWAAGVGALLGADVNERDVLEWLSSLEHEEMVQRTAGAATFAGLAEYAFRHDLMREAAYAMLTDADRMTGHRLAGRWLQEHGEDEPIVLAEHFAGGGAAEEALSWFERAAEQALSAESDAGSTEALTALRNAATYFRRAGETAVAAFANDSAMGFFERAVALWSSLDPAESARTRLALAAVRERVGQRELAMADLARAEQELRNGMADPQLQVQLLLQRANLEVRGQREGALDRARRLAEEARDIAKQSGQQDAEAQALTALAAIHCRYDTEESLERSLRYAERALAMQRSSSAVGHGLWRLGNMLLRRNDLGRALPLYRDALAWAESSKDDVLTAKCLANMGMLSFRQWRLDEAIERMERALALYRRIGNRTWITEGVLNLGFFHQVRGDVTRARPLLENALTMAGDDRITATTCQESLADLERQVGNEARAQDLLAAAAQICERVHVAHKHAFYLGLLAESCWASGDPRQAVACLEHAVDVEEAVTLSHCLILVRMARHADALNWLPKFAVEEPDPNRRVAAKLALARVHWWLGSVEEARTACREAAVIIAATDVPRVSIPVRALAACLDGDLRTALVLLREARASGCRLALADAALDTATLFGELGAASHADLVPEFIDMTADISDLGIRFRIEDLRARLLMQSGDAETARACLRIARADVEHLRTALPPEHVSVLDEHPWVQAIERYRLVP